MERYITDPIIRRVALATAAKVAKAVNDDGELATLVETYLARKLTLAEAEDALAWECECRYGLRTGFGECVGTSAVKRQGG